MKIDRSITLFLNYCRSKQLRPKTLQSYEQTLALFAKWLRESEKIEEVEEIMEITIREYMLNLQERGKYSVCVNARSKEINYPEHRMDFMAALSNTTINNYLRNIRAYINWMVEMEMIAKSPMRRIKLLKQTRRPRDYMTDDEVKYLLRVFDKSLYSEHRDLMIAMVMLDCGTRLGETLSIETEQVDLYEMTITLPAEKTKGRKDRVVFFSQHLARDLRRWLHYKESECESRYLFPVRETGFMVKISNYERNFRNYMQRTGIEKHISPHTLRNNFAKRCLMSGMDVYTLSRILGHSSIKITERAYLDITDDDLKKRYARCSPLDNIYFRD